MPFAAILRLGAALGIGLGLVPAALAPVSAQSAPAVKSLRGVIFDSLAQGPLAGATVRVVGGPALARTDEKGRFRFDSVATGPVTLAVEHPLLDSIGLYELSARVTHDGRHEHRVGVPSFATMSRALCGRELPADSAVLFGAIRTTDARPARDAYVVIAWLGVQRTAEGKLGQSRLSYSTRTDSLGRYLACGLPADEPYTFLARGRGADSLATLALTLPARRTPLLHQDVMLTAPLATAATGVVRGLVVGDGGEPLPNTRVAVAEVAEVRTDSLGRFILRDVPAGSRELEALVVGRSPVMQLVTVRARDTVSVTFTLERVTALRTVRTEATVLTELTRNFEERRRAGIGRFRDSVELAGAPSVVASLSSFPSVVARQGRGGIPVVLLPKVASITGGVGQCVARLYVDGRPEQWDRVAGMVPQDVAWMEVYARAALVPAEFQVTTKGDACGVVSIVTKAQIAK